MADQDTAGGRQDRRLKAGRPEAPLNPLDGPLSRFAHELRQLRAAAGYPSYRVLAKTAFYSASALSTAASGAAFPSLAITLAYAGACGADPAEWRQRWEAAAGLVRQPGASRADAGEAAAAGEAAVGEAAVGEAAAGAGEAAGKADPRTCRGPLSRSGRAACRTRRPGRAWLPQS
jgi:Helix-turn-helix domain